MKSQTRGQILIVTAALSLGLFAGCHKGGAAEPEAAEPVSGGEVMSQTEAEATPAAPLPSDLEGEPVSEAVAP